MSETPIVGLSELLNGETAPSLLRFSPPHKGATRTDELGYRLRCPTPD